ncbi:Cell division protein FtsZ [Candidatus Hepatincolaceae symbiont of Richtersius coronifer]
MIKKFTSIDEVNNLTSDDIFKPQIAMIGIGGAGTNAINNLINMELSGVKFVVLNTDAQSLEKSVSPYKLQIGPKITKGLGAGSKPEIGIQAAEESEAEIKEILKHTNLLFIASGMGGGTGTGATQVIAKIAKDMGILSIAFVTKPFAFEGTQRMEIAELGIAQLEKYVDSLVVISNQNLFKITDNKTSMISAFRATDSVLYLGVKAITDLIVSTGLVNLDFNDIKSVVEGMGRTMIGSAEGEGEKRATALAEACILNPLLEDVSIKGAKKVLINVTGGDDMTLYEIDSIIHTIKKELDPEAFINFGAIYDEKLNSKIRVSIVATGLLKNSSQDMAFFPPYKENAYRENKFRENTLNYSRETAQPSIKNYFRESQKNLREVRENQVNEPTEIAYQTQSSQIKHNYMQHEESENRATYNSNRDYDLSREKTRDNSFHYQEGLLETSLYESNEVRKLLDNFQDVKVNEGLNKDLTNQENSNFNVNNSPDSINNSTTPRSFVYNDNLKAMNVEQFERAPQAAKITGLDHQYYPEESTKEAKINLFDLITKKNTTPIASLEDKEQEKDEETTRQSNKNHLKSRYQDFKEQQKTDPKEESFFDLPSFLRRR